MNDFYQKLIERFDPNIWHVVGGFVIAFVILVVMAYRTKRHRLTHIFWAMMAGFLANIIWEVVIDVWRLIPMFADSAGFTWGDPLRGLGGAFFMCLIYFIYEKDRMV
jgi:hypothetical protein